VIDLRKPGSRPVAVFTGLEHQWNYVGNRGTQFYFSTDKDSPMKRVVAVELARPAAVATIIPEAKQALDSVSMIGGNLIASYLVDAKSEVHIYSAAGKRLSTVALPGLGSVSGFGGDSDDPETFFAFTSYNRPTTIYRLDASTGQSSEWAVPKLTFDPQTIAFRCSS
jgi:prolyl oligopeptidase